jgi:predicted RNase H-like HicB family nuclease
MAPVYTEVRSSTYGRPNPAGYHREGIWHDQISQIDDLNKPGTDRPMPVSLILRYAELAVRHAIVDQQEDGEWLATIRGFPGVWARERSAVEALDVLKEVVFEWALLKVEDEDRDLPSLSDIDLNLI